MEIYKVIGTGFLISVLSILFKEYKKEYQIYILIIGGITLLFFSIDKIKEIIFYIKDLSAKCVYSEYIETILKITGIAILAEYASSICEDSGEKMVAKKIDYCAKIIILSISLPIFTKSIDMLLKILP